MLSLWTGRRHNPDLLTYPDEVIVDCELSNSKSVRSSRTRLPMPVLEGAPELRQLDNGAFVRIDNVLNVSGDATAIWSTKESTYRCRHSDFRE